MGYVLGQGCGVWVTALLQNDALTRNKNKAARSNNWNRF